MADIDLDAIAGRDVCVGDGPHDDGIVHITDAEVDRLVTIARWAQNAPHYEDCDARGWRDGERPPCSCRRDEALRPFGGDRAIRHVAERGFVWPSAGLALCDEVDRLRAALTDMTDAAVEVWLNARLGSAVDTDWIVSGTAMTALRDALDEQETP